MLLSSKTILLSLSTALAVTGCGSMDIIFNNTADVDISAIPVREYNEQVEGSNAIILADTPQELNYYVPDTGWQE